ncbi:uncharacterized protein DNG_02372 [Cephalotrichum gorgonifer]|uniref:Uncharacterized protein n=1 Tax=Cephalotrichum gorgonifer TaxID=2041049 RepID=A0AAE8MUC7_9PEZI|nr:uncharacterized protein DNG_02372 [Cephalotrichum gorgonifer]
MEDSTMEEEDSKTPTRAPAFQQDISTPSRAGSTRFQGDVHRSSPNAPRLLRTAATTLPTPYRTLTPSNNDGSESELDASKEQPNELPSLYRLRRSLRAANIDERYMNRPLIRPKGPREAPPAPQRLKRHRNGEPGIESEVLAAGVGHGQPVPAVGGRPMSAMGRARAQPAGPRPLVLSPSMRRLYRPESPGLIPQPLRLTGALAPAQDTIVTDENDDSGSNSSTPKASRLNKRPALSSNMDMNDA